MLFSLFQSCLVSLFFEYIYIVGYTMPPMDLKLFLYYNKYYTNTSLCILQSLQQSLSENQTIAKVTVNVTEIPPPAIDCIECLWIRWNALKTKCTKIGFLSKKRVAEDIQDILSEKVFEFLFFFVLLFVSILLLSSCLWRFRTEHQRFTSLKQQHEHVKQQDERCWATKEHENDVR